MTKLATLVVDWGTSSLRAWLVDDESATEIIRSETGVKDFPDRASTTAFLINTLAPHLEGVGAIEGVGMISSTLGIHETPYLSTPVSLGTLLSHRLESDCVVESPRGTRLPVRVGHGVSHLGGDVRDVMRGEELQALAVTSDGIVICPGSHSKWIEVRDGQIMRFSTYLTGELFSSLSQHTALREPLVGGDQAHPDWGDGFTLGLTSNPVDFSQALFLVRARWLSDKNPHTAAGMLSGLVLGMEWRHALDVYSPHDVILIGNPATTDVYSLAADHFGVTHATHPDHSVIDLFRPHPRPETP